MASYHQSDAPPNGHDWFQDSAYFCTTNSELYQEWLANAKQQQKEEDEGIFLVGNSQKPCEISSQPLIQFKEGREVCEPYEQQDNTYQIELGDSEMQNLDTTQTRGAPQTLPFFDPHERHARIFDQLSQTTNQLLVRQQSQQSQNPWPSDSFYLPQDSGESPILEESKNSPISPSQEITIYFDQYPENDLTLYRNQFKGSPFPSLQLIENLGVGNIQQHQHMFRSYQKHLQCSTNV
ncbi:hypothetical protein FGO68_gene2084 [Halteria grandinella]|uniref:Uncharacterized protein n=1 Tax=Halteria grandinella TaxID=5974 RepID=A0A8J8T1V0_HALGN|nr:hypothetical protein FGO68_gene2084 [Halteria grandinella]